MGWIWLRWVTAGNRIYAFIEIYWLSPFNYSLLTFDLKFFFYTRPVVNLSIIAWWRCATQINKPLFVCGPHWFGWKEGIIFFVGKWTFYRLYLIVGVIDKYSGMNLLAGRVNISGQRIYWILFDKYFETAQKYRNVQFTLEKVYADNK